MSDAELQKRANAVRPEELPQLELGARALRCANALVLVALPGATGAMVLERPLRYVLEYAHTRFLGELEGALGFEYMNSFELGLELDTSKYDT